MYTQIFSNKEIGDKICKILKFEGAIFNIPSNSPYKNKNTLLSNLMLNFELKGVSLINNES